MNFRHPTMSCAVLDTHFQDSADLLAHRAKQIFGEEGAESSQSNILSGVGHTRTLAQYASAGNLATCQPTGRMTGGSPITAAH